MDNFLQQTTLKSKSVQLQLNLRVKLIGLTSVDRFKDQIVYW